MVVVVFGAFLGLYDGLSRVLGHVADLTVLVGVHDLLELLCQEALDRGARLVYCDLDLAEELVV